MEQRIDVGVYTYTCNQVPARGETSTLDSLPALLLLFQYARHVLEGSPKTHGGACFRFHCHHFEVISFLPGSGKAQSTRESAKKASKLGRVSSHLQLDEPLLRRASQLPGIITVPIVIRHKNCQSCINRPSGIQR